MALPVLSAGSQRFTSSLQKTFECVHRRGGAALQGRVTRVKSAWALAPVVVIPQPPGGVHGLTAGGAFPTGQLQVAVHKGDMP